MSSHGILAKQAVIYIYPGLAVLPSQFLNVDHHYKLKVAMNKKVSFVLFLLF